MTTETKTAFPADGVENPDGVFTRRPSRSPIRSPLTARSDSAGSSSSHSALMVGNCVVTSNTPSARTTTTAGPLACGSQPN